MHTRNIVIGAVLIITVAVMLFMWNTVRTSEPKDAALIEERRAYVSDLYGYSVEIPEGYAFHEYAEESLAIGQEAGDDGFNSVADLQLYSAGDDVGYERFEDFVADTLRNACAADGPNETIYCEDIAFRQPYESATGMMGEVLYLQRIYENLETGEKNHEHFGPLFIFNISANVPEARFAMLTVKPPAHLATHDVDSVLLRQVADTVFVNADTADARDERQLAIVMDIAADDDAPHIIFAPAVWLTGEEAVIAAAEDSSCDIENAAECVPSLNNDFYIRHTEAERTDMTVAPDAVVMLQESAHAVERALAAADLSIEQRGSLPFYLTISSGVVTMLEEVYLP